jgi:hypothetical protein
MIWHIGKMARIDTSMDIGRNIMSKERAYPLFALKPIRYQIGHIDNVPTI